MKLTAFIGFRRALAMPASSLSGAAQAHKLTTSAVVSAPDLYGDRTDREPCPSPLPGLTARDSSDPDNHEIPEECYPIHDDPAAPSAHPSEADFHPTQQHPPDRTAELTRDTCATASAGDPDRDMEAACRVTKTADQEHKQGQQPQEG